MVKLLRFTSEDNNGVFTSTLDQELRIPKNAKIALASVALEIQRDELVIDNSNHDISFQILDSATRNIALSHTDGNNDRPLLYNSTNYQVLFDDMILQMNDAIGSVGVGQHIEHGSEIGKQAEIKKDRNGKVEIKLQSALSLPYGSQLLTNTPLKVLPEAAGLIKCLEIVNPTDSTTVLLANTATAQGNDSYKCTTSQTHPMARGCGVHRFRFKSLQNNGASTVRGGASISLHETNPSTYMNKRDMTKDDIKYGIKAAAAFDAGGNQVGVYHTKSPAGGADFTVTTIPISASGADSTKDFVSLEIVGNIVRGVVYRDDGVGNPTVATVLFFEQYDNKPLYASYSLHGAGTVSATPTYGCRIDQLRYTPDPFLSQFDPKLSILPITEGKDLTNSTPTRQSPVSTKHLLNFTGNDLSEFLGYGTPRQPATDFITARLECIFTAQNVFKSAVINDCFMIEMLNLSVESYDFHSTQRKRKNILAVLPFDDTSDKCIFQPNTLAYLDLFNKDDYFTSEIKLRIIRGDYGSVELSGLSTVVIYLQ